MLPVENNLVTVGSHAELGKILFSHFLTRDINLGPIHLLQEVLKVLYYITLGARAHGKLNF